jgi:hypothetical protein
MLFPFYDGAPLNKIRYFWQDSLLDASIEPTFSPCYISPDIRFRSFIGSVPDP